MKILLLNQCFWPDIVATAQQLTGVARALVERGHQVTVITGRRGYDDARLRFPRRENWDGIQIIRVPSISLRKSSRWRRALNFASFSGAAAFRLILARPQDTVIALTSPPLVSWLGALFTRIKGGSLIFWVMDLNPDEAIAAGWLKADSLTAKILAALLQSSMRHAERIIVLDRFMKQRIVAKGIPESRIEVIPPTSDAAVSFDEKGREVFRLRHRLSSKFVVMYAGNHSPCHPLDTLLAAARKLSARDDIAFVFAGGGSELSKVKLFAQANQLEGIRCLPYEPQTDLPAMLSAADLHLVVMGEAFPGIVHPSKIYNIMAVGSPFLYIGPEESHVTEIMAGLEDQQQASWAQHGQVDALVKIISERADGFRANQNRGRFSREPISTLAQFISSVESCGETKGVRGPTVRDGSIASEALPDGRASDHA